MAFSPLFREFFEKYFPNLSKKLKESQEQQIEQTAEEITQKTTCEEILETLTKNGQLMRLFATRVTRIMFSRCSQCDDFRRFPRSEVLICFATLGLLGCLVAVIFLRKALPQEAVNILSMIAGVFSACLKDVYGKHRQMKDEIPDFEEESSSDDLTLSD